MQSVKIFGFYILVLVRFLTSTFVLAADLPDMSEELNYLAQRDMILSKNIANSDTPGYLPKDLNKRTNTSYIHLNRTNPLHFDVNQDITHEVTEGEILELKPNKNGVNIENEMLKKSENADRIKEISNIYSKTRGMVRTAIGSNR